MIAKVDEREGDEMKAKNIRRLALKANQKALELVDPGERPLTHKPQLVDLRVKVARTTALYTLAITLVLWNVRSNATVPQQLTRRFGVETRVSVKEGICIAKLKLIKLAKDVLQAPNQFVTIIMIPGKDLTRGQHKAVCIGQRDNVARFGLLATLIGNCLAPFFATAWLPSRLRSARLSS